MKRKGFTLIELIVVLVILAVISLIVTPIVITMVKKSEEAANKRSVDGYGKAIENAIAQKLLETGNYPTSIDELEIEYSGKEVTCETKILKEDYTIYLTECSVEGKEVKDESTDDGYYHYGKAIEYETYNVGDQITYQGELYYTITPSSSTKDYVTLLKAEPLTYEEVNTYGEGEINKYLSNVGMVSGEAGKSNIYGTMIYYNTENCTSTDSSNCTTDYNQSDIKKVVDRWTNDKLIYNELKEVAGYKTRLLTLNELKENLGYELKPYGTDFAMFPSDSTPNWVYNSDYYYWTMSPEEDNPLRIYAVECYFGGLFRYEIYVPYLFTVRPVINLRKSAVKNNN